MLSEVLHDDRAQNVSLGLTIVAVIVVAIAVDVVVNPGLVQPSPESPTMLGMLLEYLGIAFSDLLFFMPVGYLTVYLVHIPRSGFVGSLFWPFFYVRAP